MRLIDNKDHTHTLIREFLTHFDDLDATDTLVDSIWTLLRLHDSKGDGRELKLVSKVLNELRHTIKVFHPYHDIRKISMFGSARTKETEAEYKMAEEFASKITSQGYMVITGAGGGIMEAGNKGARANMSFGANIDLPFEQSANKYIAGDPKLVNYHYFFTRKLAFVKESDATVLFPGGFGTHDEGFEILTLLQTGRTAPRPIAVCEPEGSSYWQTWETFIREDLLQNELISEEDLCLFKRFTDVDKAIHYIKSFFKVYHSIHFYPNTAVMRLNNALTADTIAELNKRFEDILTEGEIYQYGPHSHELDSNEYPDKYRLDFKFNMKNYGRLHEMIWAINHS